ncbi:MAG: hypothetical protein ACRDDZ_02130 [Marinifilaceae bacterium]
MNIQNIKHIAQYESKLLRRSWLFRIFALLAIVLTVGYLLGIHTSVFNKTGIVWAVTSLPSMIAFSATYFYTLIQSILVVFLAGGFLTRDKKLDTAEVVFVRPMSNTDYIVGKTWGVARVFLGLNIFLLIVAMFIQGVINHYPMSVYPFIYYFFTLSLPSLLFMLGLSYTILLIVCSQPIMMIITLGLAGISYFYMEHTAFGIFDLFGIQQPVLFSDFNGMASTINFLSQRGVYFLLGIGLIALTCGMFKRIPQHPWSSKMAVISGTVLSFLALLLGGSYVLRQSAMLEDTLRYAESYNQFASLPEASALTHSIVYTHSGNSLEAESEIKLYNRHEQALNEIILFLNPGLTITSASVNSTPVQTTRENQVVRIAQTMASKDTVILRLTYNGTIDENIAYTDLTAEEKQEKRSRGTYFKAGQRNAYISKDFTLLTPEIVWYPTTVAPNNPSSRYALKQDYTLYSLEVKNTNNLLAISQGKRVDTENGYKFENQYPLVNISLTIGNYETKSIIIDSTYYAVNYLKGHDFFSKEYENLSDTLPELIRVQRDNYERAQAFMYPFNKLELTEVPVHFASHVRNWKGYTEKIAPEIVFYPEYGAGMHSDIPSIKYRSKTWRRGNEEPSEMEVNIQTFNSFPIQELTNTTSRASWGSSDINHTNISGMLFDFNGYFYSARYPMINRIIKSMMQDNEVQGMRGWWSINDNRKAAIYLGTHSLQDAITDKDLKPTLLKEVIVMKAEALKQYLITHIGVDSYFDLTDYLYEQAYNGAYDFDDFTSMIKNQYRLDLDTFLTEWYTIKATPSLYTRNSKADKVIIDDTEMYKVEFMINNPSDATAIIATELISGGNRGSRGPRMMTMGGGGGDDEMTKLKRKKFYIIPPHGTYRVTQISESQPSGITINTNISDNIPANFRFSFDKITTETLDTTQGVFPISPELFADEKGVIIIDNEDDGFRVINSNSRMKLRNLLQNWKNEEEFTKYKDFNPWMTPGEWTPIVGNSYHGNHIQSAYYRSKGVGNSFAVWETTIPEGGYYELYIWNPGQMRGPGGHRGGDQAIFQYYTISFDGDNEEMELQVNPRDSEWTSMGRFRFDEKTKVSVTLSDKTDRNYVIADAIKFVRTE